MSRPDRPLVLWKHYAHGYEAVLSSHGWPFARARMVKGVPGIHYELIWIHGPALWRPMRVHNIMRIEGFVDRWVAHHLQDLLRKMPHQVPVMEPFDFYGDPRTCSLPKFPEQAEREIRRTTCPGCGRRRGLCSRSGSKGARKPSDRWPCAGAA